MSIQEYYKEEMIKKPVKFYRCRDGSLYPAFKEDLWKLININDEDSFLPFLEDMDYPYYKEKWRKYMRISGDLGKYISFMNLKGMKRFTYKDSDLLNSKWL